MLVVEPGDPAAPGATALLRASHALMQKSFPAEENHHLSPEALGEPDITFYVARIGDQTLGTGALKLADGYGELKSMFVAEDARGKGIAAAILRQIEDQARALGLPLLMLETGDTLDAAHRLYERHGFARCGPFGDYKPNKTSVFMHKHLDRST